MTQILETIFTVSFLAAALRLAVPLIFGTLGELIGQRAGVMNLGIEGIMTAGAMAAWYTVYLGGDLYLGVIVAALVGSAFGWLHAQFAVRLGVSQHVSGIAITLLATGLSYFFVVTALPHSASGAKIVPFSVAEIPLLSKLPVLGPTLFSQNVLGYIALLSVPAVAYVLFRTPIGLLIRMAGENPLAVEGEGVDVLRLRVGAVMAGSALMGIGGAYLSLAAFDTFIFGMVAGRGWVCIALVFFASWKPWRALAGALMFAAFDALQLRQQQQAFQVIPYQFFLAMPYMLSIAVLAITSRGLNYPRALFQPFRRGER